MSRFTAAGSRRMQAVQTPIVPVIADLLARHPEAVSLGQGVVHYAPPPAVQQAALDYRNAPGDNRYGPVDGEPALQAALATKLREENGIDVRDGASGIMVTGGANMAFLHAVLAICDPGDEVILPLPYYFNHEMALRIAGVTPVLVATGAGFQLDLARVREHITPRTRAVVTVSPNNPTGAVYRPGTLHDLNTLCRERGLYHISDEAYEYFVHDGARHVSPGAAAGSAAHTISLFSFSKAYGMAAWRVGYLVAPAALLPALRKLHDTNAICITRLAQQAALAALSAGRDWCQERIASLNPAREAVQRALRPLAGSVEVTPAGGAFYTFLRVATTLPALTLATRLVTEFGVATIPGSAFGLEDGCYLRLSYGGGPEAQVAEGMERLIRGLTALTSNT